MNDRAHTGKPLRFAVIGAGGFARFAVEQFVKRPGTQLAGVYDRDAGAATLLCERHPGAKAYATLEALLDDPLIDLVYIASPPFLHYEQSLAALRAGKHVICEKPAALEEAHARELMRVAQEHDLLFVVNLMQRYNPLYLAVKRLIDTQILGAFVHGFFENYASDEFLPATHWFWDQAQSGGIFIEHGVHFFDMFAGWFGEGRVVASQKLARPGCPDIWDIAQCDVVYGGNAPVRFYHAFNQPKALDRQELRLQFERGEVTLFEWVPTRLVLNGLCTTSQIEQLHDLFPSTAMLVANGTDVLHTAHGRFKQIDYHRKIHLDTGESQSKSQIYEGLVSGMFDDQLAWLGDRTRQRLIDATNAVDSLAVAEQAEKTAQWIV